MIKLLDRVRCRASFYNQAFALLVLVICPRNDTLPGFHNALFTGQIGETHGIQGNEGEDTLGEIILYNAFMLHI